MPRWGLWRPQPALRWLRVLQRGGFTGMGNGKVRSRLAIYHAVPIFQANRIIVEPATSAAGGPAAGVSGERLYICTRFKLVCFAAK